MTNGFVMKTHKTPKEEIQIAKDRRKDLILKIGQNLENGVYAFVPTLDFYNNSPDIDWSQSIADIDQKLYKKI